MSRLDDVRRLRGMVPPMSWRNIAKELGIGARSMERWLANQRKVGNHEFDAIPMLQLQGKSTLKRLEADGSVSTVMWWDKEKAGASAAAAAIQAFGDALVLRVQGLAKPTKLPKPIVSDLMNVIPMGDPHFGMYAWAAEAGDNFDIDIARKLMIGAVHYVSGKAPVADTALLINLGDFYHADNGKNETPGSSHKLDVDGRYAKVFLAGVDAMQELVELLLRKHSRVIVRNVRGNHDPHLAWCLAVAMHAYWRNEPRVTIDLDPGDYWYRRFGNNLIGVCHGHLAKAEALPGIMARDMGKEWGATDHHFWYVGHFHHSHSRDIQGTSVEIFRTLAPNDAWAHAAGYRSLRSLDCITLHREWGYETRARCCHKRALATYEAMEAAA